MDEKNFEEFEEEAEIITLTGEDGEEVEFEYIGDVEYDERMFAVLLPLEDEDDGVVILEVLPIEGEEEVFEFVSVDDDKLLETVFEIFKKNYEGEYGFE